MATRTRVPHLSLDERRAKGKEARNRTSPGSHTGWVPTTDRPDPVGLLDEQNATRDVVAGPEDAAGSAVVLERPLDRLRLAQRADRAAPPLDADAGESAGRSHGRRAQGPTR